MAFLKRKVASWVLTTICLLFGLAAWATPLMPNGKCIVTSEFALADVRIGDSVEKVTETLGEARNKTQEFDEYYIDDVTQWVYDDIEVTTSSDGRVLDLRTASASPSISTPSGIRPGLSPEKVSAILGYDIWNSLQSTGRNWRGFLGCTPDGRVVSLQLLSLRFDDEGQLRQVHIFETRDSLGVFMEVVSSSPLTFFGYLLAGAASLALIVLAFKQRLLWGLGCLLMPPVVLVFGIVHGRKAATPLVLIVLGGLLMFLGLRQ